MNVVYRQRMQSAKRARPHRPAVHARAASAVMKDIVLADKELEAKIMSVVGAEPSRTKCAAVATRTGDLE